MIDPTYQVYIDGLEDAMYAARKLGLFRTAEQVHKALQTAREEQFEAMPPPQKRVTVNFIIGPVREQKL